MPTPVPVPKSSTAAHNSTGAVKTSTGAAQTGGAKSNKSSASVPLPDASELDPAVLDALPLAVRREIERACGGCHLRHFFSFFIKMLCQGAGSGSAGCTATGGQEGGGTRVW